MRNERKTESLVRDHFRKYTNGSNGAGVIIEEQRSDSSIVDKLLENASKSGEGRGQPDFIIRPLNKSDFIIVIECKASIRDHKSTDDKKGHEKYAVDGVLHYAEYLSRELDVLAIAVSGNRSKSRISHFLRLKGQHKNHEIFGDELLSPKEYIDGYQKSPPKYRQDYKSLQFFIKNLNEELQIDKVTEASRSLFISSVLIALERDSFKKSSCQKTYRRFLQGRL